MSEEDKKRGLYPKYGRPPRADDQHLPGGKHAECGYFVLDIEHDPFAKAALTAYAGACAEGYPRLALELYELTGRQPYWKTLITANSLCCACGDAEATLVTCMACSGRLCPACKETPHNPNHMNLREARGKALLHPVDQRMLETGCRLCATGIVHDCQAQKR